MRSLSSQVSARVKKSEHFLLRKIVGTSKSRIGVFKVTFALLWSIVRGVYFLFRFLNIGFLEIAAIWYLSGLPAARPFSHCRKLGEMHSQSNTEKMGRWHGPQTQQEVVTHECHQAYTKQILENCCEKIQEKREEPQWISLHNLRLNRLRALNELIDAFSTTVGNTEDLSSSNKTSMREKKRTITR